MGALGGPLSVILEALGTHWATIGGPARPHLICSQFWLPFGVHFGSILAQETLKNPIIFLIIFLVDFGAILDDFGSAF